jgi:hypothetical protein
VLHVCGGSGVCGGWEVFGGRGCVGGGVRSAREGQGDSSALAPGRLPSCAWRGRHPSSAFNSHADACKCTRADRHQGLGPLAQTVSRPPSRSSTMEDSGKPNLLGCAGGGVSLGIAHRACDCCCSAVRRCWHAEACGSARNPGGRNNNTAHRVMRQWRMHMTSLMVPRRWERVPT